MLIDECEGPRIRRCSSRRREPDPTVSPIGAGEPHPLARGFEALHGEPFVRIRRACNRSARIEWRLLSSPVQAGERERDGENDSDS